MAAATPSMMGIQPDAPTRIACVMVGLPARGKTFIAQKVSRYLNWLGVETRVWNVGNYRRKMAGAQQPHPFYDQHNVEASLVRKQAALAALEDMLSWLKLPTERSSASLDGSTSSSSSSSTSSGGPNLNPAVSHSSLLLRQVLSDGRQSPAMLALRNSPEDHAKVAIYDATNSTLQRRALIREYCGKAGVQTIFIESICTDAQLIRDNILEVKLSSPDYLNIEATEAAADFQERIRHYEEAYQTLSGSSGSPEVDCSFVKLIDVGSQVIINKIHGYLQSRVVFYVMNLHITPRSILMCRHGESMFNVSGKIGGDSDLSPRGQTFARALPHIIRANLPEGQQLTVWTSTLRRTMQTGEHLDYPKLSWKALDEIDAGVCDGMTYEEIEEKFPEDFAERDKDKYHYRYRGGESYKDLVLRLEPIIMELERQQNILIIGHQAVLRAIYAYFLNLPHDKLPYVHVPLHTVIKLTPKAYGCEEETFSLPIEAVDTHRPQPRHKQRSSYGDTGPMHIVSSPQSPMTPQRPDIRDSSRAVEMVQESESMVISSTEGTAKEGGAEPITVTHQRRQSTFRDRHGVLEIQPKDAEQLEKVEEGGV